MAKIPAAMPLHVQDFQHGTAQLSNEELGAYVRALLHEWEYGAVPADDRVRLGALLHDSPRRAQQLWSRIGQKFRRGSDGQWRNGRCQRERSGAVEMRERQSARARLRWARAVVLWLVHHTCTESFRFWGAA